MDNDSKILSEKYKGLNEGFSDSENIPGNTPNKWWGPQWQQLGSEPKPETPAERRKRKKAELQYYKGQLAAQYPGAPMPETKWLIKAKVRIAQNDIEETAHDFEEGSHGAFTKFETVRELADYYNNKANLMWKVSNAKTLAQLQAFLKIKDEDWIKFMDEVTNDEYSLQLAQPS